MKPLSRGDKRTSSEPLDMLFDDRDLERTEPTTLCICRKESSVTSGLSSFPVQMNKPVFSLSVSAPGKEVSFALVVSYVL